MRSCSVGASPMSVTGAVEDIEEALPKGRELVAGIPETREGRGIRVYRWIAPVRNECARKTVSEDEGASDRCQTGVSDSAACHSGLSSSRRRFTCREAFSCALPCPQSRRTPRLDP